jgi:rhodanese-related sulfurtransferase
VLPLETNPKEVKQRMDAGEAIRLIDVREPFEHAIARVNAAELIPMGSVPVRLVHLEAQADEAALVVLCHHGVRSLQVVHWLREQGIENCQSMAGGIDAWSADVDGTVPRY